MTSEKPESSSGESRSDQQLIAGRYRTTSRIGRGRLGVIFEAGDEADDTPAPDRPVAIQVIPANFIRNSRLFNKLDTGYSKLREANHPNIVRYRKLERDGEFGYVVMDLLDGLSLRGVLDEAGPLPLNEVKPVIRGIGEALQLLHDRDIAHGSVTPANVFVTSGLEVRLLDVLPVDSCDGGLANYGPFGRCTAGQDLFDLGCLAYEMLAGQHPFNHRKPAEARAAGLEPERIAGLSDQEWLALRRALSYDGKRLMPSIADFLREFGITGTERLYATERQPDKPKPAPVIDAQEFKRIHISELKPVPKRASPLRAVALSLLLAGLIGWTQYGQPEEHLVRLIGLADTSMNLGLVDRPQDPSGPPETDPVTVVASAPVGDADVIADAVVIAEPAVSIAADGDIEESSLQSAAQLHPGDTTALTDIAPVANDGDDSEMTSPGVIIAEAVISVAEDDGAARITPTRGRVSAEPIVWWTSGHTASAEVDFISMERMMAANTLSPDDDVLHIPLVNDDVPEPPESFFVNFGLRDARLGRIERVATVRVDILDDDLP
jgi:hypothetical protein